MVSVDAFDSPETMRRLRGGLVRASAMDALMQPEGRPVPKRRAEPMLGRVRGASLQASPSPGLGEDVRVAGGWVVGSALVYGGALVHAALLRTLVSDGSGGRIASRSVRRSLGNEQDTPAGWRQARRSG